MLQWLQQRVWFSFRHVSSIVSGSCNRVESGSKEWILILRTRHPILHNSRRPFWCMWRMNTVRNIDMCWVRKPETVPSNNLIPSSMASWSGQWSFDSYESSSDVEQDWMRNNVAETASARSDRVACLLTATRSYLNSLPGSPKNCGKVIQISMITVPTKWRLATHFGYRTYWTSGANSRKRTQSTPISPICNARLSLSYHMLSEWRPVFPLGEMLLAGGSQ